MHVYLVNTFNKLCAIFSDKYGSSNFLAYVNPIASMHYIQHAVYNPTNLALEAVLRCQGLLHVSVWSIKIKICHFRGQELVLDSISATGALNMHTMLQINMNHQTKVSISENQPI